MFGSVGHDFQGERMAQLGFGEATSSAFAWIWADSEAEYSNCWPFARHFWRRAFWRCSPFVLHPTAGTRGTESALPPALPWFIKGAIPQRVIPRYLTGTPWYPSTRAVGGWHDQLRTSKTWPHCTRHSSPLISCTLCCPQQLGDP